MHRLVTVVTSCLVCPLSGFPWASPSLCSCEVVLYLWSGQHGVARLTFRLVYWFIGKTWKWKEWQYNDYFRGIEDKETSGKTLPQMTHCILNSQIGELSPYCDQAHKSSYLQEEEFTLVSGFREWSPSSGWRHGRVHDNGNVWLNLSGWISVGPEVETWKQRLEPGADSYTVIHNSHPYGPKSLS